MLFLDEGVPAISTRCPRHHDAFVYSLDDLEQRPRQAGARAVAAEAWQLSMVKSRSGARAVPEKVMPTLVSLHERFDAAR